MERKNYVRAHEFDINTFLIKMKTLDELVTDFDFLFERYKQLYYNKFLK